MKAVRIRYWDEKEGKYVLTGMMKPAVAERYVDTYEKGEIKDFDEDY